MRSVRNRRFFEIYMKILRALGHTVLDPIAQQVALGAASRANAADYAVAVHATIANNLGASREIVNTIRNGGSFKDAKLEAVRRFTSAIASKRTQVSDSDVMALLAAGYDRRGVVALALAAGAKTLVNTVAHLSRAALDPEFQAK
jgi:alkylhydroperoxidase family enzyme